MRGGIGPQPVVRVRTRRLRRRADAAAAGSRTPVAPAAPAADGRAADSRTRLRAAGRARPTAGAAGSRRRAAAGGLAAGGRRGQRRAPAGSRCRRRGGRAGRRPDSGADGRRCSAGAGRRLAALAVVHRDPELGGQPDQPVVIALPQRAELPAVAAPVQLAADQRGLLAGLRHAPRRPRAARRRPRPRRTAGSADPCTWPNGAAVRGRGQHHPVDRRRPARPDRPRWCRSARRRRCFFGSCRTSPEGCRGWL